MPIQHFDVITGRNLTVTLLAGTTAVATGLAMIESPSGTYTATEPPGLAAGTYAVLVLEGTAPIADGMLIWTGTAEADPGSPAPPSDTSMCRLYGTLELPRGAPAAGVRVTLTLQAPAGPVLSDKLWVGRTITVVTDSAGRLSDGTSAWVDVPRNDGLAPAGTQWHIGCSDAGVDTVVTLAAPTADLLSLLD